MLRHNIGRFIQAVGIFWLYAECTELKCKLTLQKAECEFYKKMLESCLDSLDTNKSTDKKEKDKK